MAIMPRYYFRIQHGEYSGQSDLDGEFTDANAAWAEMTKVCGDLVGSAARTLKQNARWEMVLLDETETPIFRIHLLAEIPTNPSLASVP